MRALTVLYGGSLGSPAFQEVAEGQSAFALSLRQAAAFPGSEKIVLFMEEKSAFAAAIPAEIKVSVVEKPAWNVSELLKTLSELGAGYDFVYYAWADSPFLDPVLAGKIAERHTRYAAEYSFADGWPEGLGPEVISSASAGILYKIAGEAGAGPVRRDSLFAVLQKDINAFDIETEISDIDLRHHRLSFTADSGRNLLLLRRFAEAFLSNKENFAGRVPDIIAGHPEYLRTLPAFFPIQVSGVCPANKDNVNSHIGSCGLCPYPKFGAQFAAKGGDVSDGNDSSPRDFLSINEFSALLDKIERFTGDAVIDISLWGEIALHPERSKLIELVLEKPALSLIVETSGYGWIDFDMAAIARKAAAAEARRNGLPALSWIVSLNTADLPEKAGLNADAESEAVSFVKKLVSFFPKQDGHDEAVYVEALRVSGEEDAVEQFYRAWKAFADDKKAPGIIIQKYSRFCGLLPPKQTVDLSPVERRPCWHLLRDFPVYLSGDVPLCREDLTEKAVILGNVFKEDMERIWKRGERAYRSHCEEAYSDTCKVCDEYYTYNF